MTSLYLKCTYTTVGENVDIVIQKCSFSLCGVPVTWEHNSSWRWCLAPRSRRNRTFRNDSSSEAFSSLLGTFSRFAVYYENHPFSSVLPAKRGPNPELWLKTRSLHDTWLDWSVCDKELTADKKKAHLVALSLRQAVMRHAVPHEVTETATKASDLKVT